MVVRKTIETQTFLFLTVPVCAILSIVIIGLVGSNISYARSRTAREDSTLIRWNVTFNDEEYTQERTVAFLPEDLRLGSYWVMLAAGIFGFLDAVALSAMLVWRKASVWRSENRSGVVRDINTWPQTPIAIGLALLAFLFSLAATIYSWLEWARSAEFDPSEGIDLTDDGRYRASQGFFTPDAWNCQFEDYIVDSDTQNHLENTCNEGTATRTVTLALCILCLGVLLSVSYRVYLRASGKTQKVASAGVFPVDEERGRSRTREPNGRTADARNADNGTEKMELTPVSSTKPNEAEKAV